MSDLITRLRKEASWTTTRAETAKLLIEAASEIETLRAATAWRPISEHNGTPFSVAVGWGKFRVADVGYWSHSLKAWLHQSDQTMFDPQPDCFALFPRFPQGEAAPPRAAQRAGQS